MYGYIYLTENLINGKCYIGQHKHKTFDKKYKGSGDILTEAIQKYGKKNFVTTIVQWCKTQQELSDAEIYWISKCDAVNSPYFYNIAHGGKGATTDAQLAALEKGRHLPASEKLKEKLRNRKELVEYTDEYRNKLSVSGKKFYEEHPFKFMRDLEGNVKRVPIEDLEEKLSLGWKKGRKDKHKHLTW